MVKRFFKVMGTVMSLIGLAGIPSNLTKWEIWINKFLNKMGFVIDLSILNQDVWRWIFVIGGFVILFIGTDSAKRLKELIWKPKAIMKIEHKENETGYYNESQYFNKQVPTEKLFGNVKTITFWRTCRISVHNLSDKKINNVEVKLVDIEPQELRGRLPLHLHFTHDNNKPFKLSKDINPSDSIFIDVVSWHWDGQNHPLYVIWSAEPNVATDFLADNRDYKIEIKVTAENLPSISKTFVFGLRKKDNTNEKIWIWPTD